MLGNCGEVALDHTSRSLLKNHSLCCLWQQMASQISMSELTFGIVACMYRVDCGEYFKIFF